NSPKNALDSPKSVVIMVLMYPRTVKVRSKSGTVNEYVRVVEAYREGSKVKQRVVADLGRKDLLLEVLPKLRRLLTGEDRDPADPQFGEAPDWGPVLVVRALFDQLGLWGILDRYLGQAKGVPFADRAFVLVANRLIAPASEHGLAGWLETDFVCDRKGRRFIPHWHQRRRVRIHPRQLDAWYRTLDQPHARPGALRHHQYLLRGRGSAGFRQAWLQPRRQVAERAGDHRHGDGRGLA